MDNVNMMTEQEMMTDLLSTEKFLTSVYNTYCCEAVTPAVRNTLDAHLADTHRTQKGVYDVMSARGWYKVESAEDAKLNQEKQKFNKMANV